RLTGIGQADQAGIGNELQSQPDPALLAWQARIGPPGSLVDRGLEMGIAEAAIATARQDEALAHLGHVHNRRLAVRLQDLRAGRDPENDVLAPGAGPVAAHAVAAALRLEVLLVAKVDEGVEPIDAFDDHIAAAAAVAAV